MTKVNMAREPQTAPKNYQQEPRTLNARAVELPLPPVASDAFLGGDMKMPPRSPPEPPMVRYWRAYSDCMSNKGY